MTEGKAVRDIALLDPTTSLWTHMGNPIHATVKGFDYIGYDQGEKLKLEKLELHWGQIGKEMLLQQRDYDHMDTEFFERAEVRNGKLIVGLGEYSVLILPPMSNLESTAWKKIKMFVEDGGTVIAAGLLPYERIEEDSPSEEEVLALFGVTESYRQHYWEDSGSRLISPWVKGEHNAYFILPAEKGEDDLADRLNLLLQQIAAPSVRLGDGNAPRSFLMQVRSMADSCVVFISNQEGETHDLPLYIGTEVLQGQTEDIRIRRLNVETGEYEVVPWQKDTCGWTLPITAD
jgi:hypothetical protein